MKKVLILTALLVAPYAYADYFDGGYVSPESYAVNEADFVDYRYIPAAPKLDVDTLESVRFKTADEQVNNEKNEVNTVHQKKEKIEKNKKTYKEEDPEAYKKRLSYKFAKWWVDQRYKREEVHHGTKHEIKVKTREEYERKLEEKSN